MGAEVSGAVTTETGEIPAESMASTKGFSNGGNFGARITQGADEMSFSSPRESGAIYGGQNTGSISSESQVFQSSNGLRGTQLASQELIDNVSSRYTVETVQPGHWLHEDFVNTQTNAMYSNGTIYIRPDARQIEVLEEFLHGQQENLGIDMSGRNYPQFEIDVKQFMIRHQQLLGISDEDVQILQQMIANYH
ncbi:MAG: hypothetical protein QM796_13155 [Chthoniobacteraceae bacterium]